MTANVIELTLEPQLLETQAWLDIREGAIRGIGLAIAVEKHGIATDERLELHSRVAERKERIEALERALKQAQAWNPLSEIPRKK